MKKMKRISGTRTAVTAPAVFIALVAAATPTHAAVQFTTTAVLKQGDSFGDYGTVASFRSVRVNDNGDWLVHANLTGGFATKALIKNGELWLATGDTVDPDDTIIIDFLDNFASMNNNGDVTYRASTLLTSGIAGLWLNSTPLIMQDQVSTSPAFPPGTYYGSVNFFMSNDNRTAHINDNNNVLLNALLSQPGVLHQAMIWLSLDGETGELQENVIAKNGWQVPGAEEGVTFNLFGGPEHQMDVNNNGDAFYVANFDNMNTDAGIFINDFMVVRRGDPSPIPGEVYSDIAPSGSSRTLGSMNIHREYAFRGKISNQPFDSNRFIFKGDGNQRNAIEIFQRFGDPVPGVPGETIESFGGGTQPLINDQGQIAWYARWGAGGYNDRGILVDDTLVLRKADVVEGLGVLTNVAARNSPVSDNGVRSALSMSNSGQYLITSVTYCDACPGHPDTDNPRAVVLIELASGSACPTCGQNSDKVLWCHVPAGNPGNPRTICIAAEAVPAHVAQDPEDSCGPCAGARLGGALDSLPSMQVDVVSNVAGAFVGIAPLDVFDSGGGVVAYQRYYQPGTVITLTAQKTVNGRRFLGWNVDGAPFGGWYNGLTLTLPIFEGYTIEAVYETSGPAHR